MKRVSDLYRECIYKMVEKMIEKSGIVILKFFKISRSIVEIKRFGEIWVK